MGVSDYSTTPGSNTAINSIGIEGSSPITNFDNALRQLMADIAAGIAAGSFTANGYVSKSAGYTVVVGDRGKIIDCTAALELELPAAATAGAGFVFIVKANGGAVTVDPNSTENINGASTSLTVADGSFAIIACTGTAWHSVVAGNVTRTGTETLTNKDISGASNTYRSASTTATGAVELATDAEAQTGTDTERAITPANLQAVTATTSRKGVVELATTAEASTGTDTARAVTPAGVAAAVPAITAGLGLDDIGAYIFASQMSGTQADPGDIVAGTTLRYGNANGIPAGSNLSGGSWMCCGRPNGVNNASNSVVLYKRVS